ncbi:FecCD family ABC transporter permease [Paenibacillus sp. 1P07SE]|uniref:FecCD family ABC transporter permease n=1 Tax=Paenibacillus sp. 1P07SE TaxID=3132209 RepID=UPI0039A6F6A5
MNSVIKKPAAKGLALAGAFVVLLGVMLAGVRFGYHTFSMAQLREALYHFDGSNAHLIIRTVRFPAVLIGAAVGASLAVAGAMMQVLTRNPLASPSVLGVNAGAVLCIVFVITMTPLDLDLGGMIWVAFAGAGLSSLLVIALGSAGRGGFRPVRMTLAGTAFAAFASSVTSGLMLLNNASLDELLFWMVGSVNGRKLESLIDLLPYLVVGWLLAMLLGRSLNIMAMDDDVAKGLGQWALAAKGLTLIAVVLLAGGSVALAGPIAFVGLMVPHICRYLIGSNHFWLIPFSALSGAALLVAADTASRFLLMPRSVPVGVATALLGVPFLIYLARRRSE